jgi:hypothetical protein
LDAAISTTQNREGGFTANIVALAATDDLKARAAQTRVTVWGHWQTGNGSYEGEKLLAPGDIDPTKPIVEIHHGWIGAGGDKVLETAAQAYAQGYQVLIVEAEAAMGSGLGPGEVRRGPFESLEATQFVGQQAAQIIFKNVPGLDLTKVTQINHSHGNYIGYHEIKKLQELLKTNQKVRYGVFLDPAMNAPLDLFPGFQNLYEKSVSIGTSELGHPLIEATWNFWAETHSSNEGPKHSEAWDIVLGHWGVVMGPGNSSNPMFPPPDGDPSTFDGLIRPDGSLDANWRPAQGREPSWGLLFGGKFEKLVIRLGAPAAQDHARSLLIRPTDPNEKVGPEGVGRDRIVHLDDELHYIIYFENVITATAPAQEVFITDKLDPDLNWASLQVTEVAFGNKIIPILEGTPQFYTQVTIPDYRSGVHKQWWVDISAQLNYQTGQVNWTFRTLDPETGELPADPLAGFLPPNKPKSGRGEGHVVFRIRPRSNLADGTVIANRASIVFDQEAPIVTNRVTNTIGSAVSVYLPVLLRKAR